MIDVPSLKQLCEYVIPCYASQWKVIGSLLGLSSDKMWNIEAEWSTDVESCCHEMLMAWLDVDTTASWKKLHNAVNSLTVPVNQSSVNKGE